MRFLVIDDDIAVRTLLKRQLVKKWPSAEVDIYDPVKSGIPESRFPWGNYDIVLLDFDMGFSGQTGIDWIPRIRNIENSPSIIMVTGQGSEDIAVKAIKAGADEYLIKYDVVTERLYDVINEVMDQRQTVSKQEKQGPMENNDPENNSVEPVIQNEYLENWNFPGYGCIREIKTGPSTTIYAERLSDKLPVILKAQKFLGGDAVYITQRFEQELNLLAGFEHPNLIGILDHQVVDAIIYYVMDYLPGGSLESRFPETTKDIDMAMNYILQIANGLKFLHDNNILHRDLNPKNIIFDENDRPVIVDLGIAKDLSSDLSLTMDGEVLGTPVYMSPEQFTGKTITVCSDIYSLGVVFYEMLVGERPYTGDTIMELVYKVTYEEPRQLPENLSRYQPVMDKLLAKNPDDRYQDVGEFITALEALGN